MSNGSSIGTLQGVRANMLRSYASHTDHFLSSCDAAGCGTQWRQLLFVATFMHAVIQERRKFGALGWSIPYEFSDGDYTCALRTLHMFLLESSGAHAASHTRLPAGPGSVAATAAAHLPWEALLYVTGQINYGGRVTDENDRRLFMCLMHQHYCPEVLLPDHALTAAAGELGGVQETEVHSHAMLCCLAITVSCLI